MSRMPSDSPSRWRWPVCWCVSAPAVSRPRRRPAPAAGAARGATGHRQAVLRRLPQRSLEDGRRQLRGTDPDSIAKHPDLFEKAVRKLRGRVMPPPGARQPEPAAVDSLVAWLEDSLDRAAGPAYLRDDVELHRLNRKEYANAVRDLLAVEVDAAALLPADDVADGFDNIASALQVSPSFIEQYVIAARQVAVKAMGRPDARPGGWSFRAGPGTQLTHVAGLPLGTRGGILGHVDSRRTVSTTSTSPTWSPTSGAAGWSSRTPSS